MAAIHRDAFAQDRPWSVAEFRGLLSAPGCFACGGAAAFALVRVTLDEAELLTIATHPDHHRQGMARELMAQWQKRAATMGASRAFLEVAADNAPALALYRDAGFEQVGARRGYYARTGKPAVDAIVMARDLG